MARVPSLRGVTIVTDKGPPIVLTAGSTGQMRFHLYVDNLGALACSEAEVAETLGESKDQFNRKQLLLRDEEIHQTGGIPLGVRLNGESKTTMLTEARFWKLRQGIMAVLKRRRISGRLLEIVVGHATFCALVNRLSLSIFHTVYRFVCAHYYVSSQLWSSVSDELYAFVGAMWFLQSDWTRGWNPYVASSDAGLYGFRLASSFWPRSVVAAVGRVSERSRFKRAAGHGARESALQAAGFCRDSVSGQWVLDEEESGWEPVSDFPEAPAEWLHRDRWFACLWGPWRFTEGIIRLEARALVKAVSRIANSVFGKNSRQLVLVDNMSVCLAFEQCRSKEFKLLIQMRRYAA
jgi:hypothetical protein